jgi:hypothetical protein
MLANNTSIASTCHQGHGVKSSKNTLLAFWAKDSGAAGLQAAHKQADSLVYPHHEGYCSM